LSTPQKDDKPAVQRLYKRPTTGKKKQNMLKLSDFDYNLPEELVAQTPADKRQESRLCVFKNKEQISDSVFSCLPDFIPENSLVILNNTKVFSSRLFGKLSTGGKVELFLLSSPFKDNASQNIRAVCLGRPMKKFKVETVLYFPESLEAKIVEKYETSAGARVVVEFNKSLDDLYSWFESYAKIPLPPYIKREKEDELDEFDKERYQTVYATHQGSVAAPTAGLHFTDDILENLEKKNIEIDYVTLHVGAGTFMPVKTEDISLHDMHGEIFSISKETLNKIEKAKSEGRSVIVVGTTAFRAIESLGKFSERNFERAYELCDTWNETSLFIRPETKGDRYNPWITDAIITNFHQPKSTLFMLVCALIGYENAQSYYDRAIKERYRFFSYGDSNLFWIEA
jgi:S-adenosylmethionine:tRNA ribosyltransferase-isomerase